MTYPHGDEPEKASETLQDALAAHGVHMRFPAERAQLAATLAAHGYIPEDLQLLADSIDGTRKKIAAVMAAALKDPKVASVQIQDIRKCQQARQRKRKPYPGEKQLRKGTMSFAGEFANLDENQNRRMAYALVRADRHNEPGAAEHAAREIGCTAKQAQEWADHELAIRYADAEARALKAKKVEQTPEQFRERVTYFADLVAQGKSPADLEKAKKAKAAKTKKQQVAAWQEKVRRERGLKLAEPEPPPPLDPRIEAMSHEERVEEFRRTMNEKRKDNG